MNVKKCTGKTKDGRPCNNPAQNGSEFCYSHNPKTRDKRLKASIKGGKRSRIPSNKVLPDDTPDIELKTPEDAEALIALSISRVQRGDIAPNVATAVNQLLSSWIKIREVTDHDARFEKLEKYIAQRQGSGSPVQSDGLGLS